MPHNLEQLLGSWVHATDKEIGAVRNFLFDDTTWTVRYIEVDVGHWLQRREVLLAPEVLREPDWANRIFNVKYRREQVRNSPDVDTESLSLASRRTR